MMTYIYLYVLRSKAKLCIIHLYVFMWKAITRECFAVLLMFIAGVHVGCFDHICFQIEYNVTFEDGTLNSPDSCSSACRNKGYLYAGLQGSLCVCSCKRPCQRTQYPMEKCGTPCPKSNVEHYCGGHSSYTSIYSGGFYVHTHFSPENLAVSIISKCLFVCFFILRYLRLKLQKYKENNLKMQ